MDFLDRANLTLESFEKVLREEEHQLPLYFRNKGQCRSRAVPQPRTKKVIGGIGTKKCAGPGHTSGQGPFLHLYQQQKIEYLSPKTH